MEKMMRRKLTNPKAFRAHGLIYICINVLIFILDWVVGGAWWFHFITLIWGFFLVIHFLGMKTFTVDERWAEERSARLRYDSYDVGHIMQISNDYNDREKADSTDVLDANRSPAEGHRETK